MKKIRNLIELGTSFVKRFSGMKNIKNTCMCEVVNTGIPTGSGTYLRKNYAEKQGRLECCNCIF